MREPFNFWRNVRVDAQSGCWLWSARVNKDGYGVFGGSSTRGTRLAHRFAYQTVHNRQLLQTVFLCHSCDKPSCVNPTHMFTGTQADNMADKVRKDRQAKGEKQGISKLDDCAVRQIRAMYATGMYTQRQVGDRFGVTQAAIWYVLHSLTWNHVK